MSSRSAREAKEAVKRHEEKIAKEREIKRKKAEEEISGKKYVIAFNTVKKIIKKGIVKDFENITGEAYNSEVESEVFLKAILKEIAEEL